MRLLLLAFLGTGSLALHLRDLSHLPELPDQPLTIPDPQVQETSDAMWQMYRESLDTMQQMHRLSYWLPYLPEPPNGPQVILPDMYHHCMVTLKCLPAIPQPSETLSR